MPTGWVLTGLHRRSRGKALTPSAQSATCRLSRRPAHGGERRSQTSLPAWRFRTTRIARLRVARPAPNPSPSTRGPPIKRVRRLPLESFPVCWRGGASRATASDVRASVRNRRVRSAACERPLRRVRRGAPPDSSQAARMERAVSHVNSRGARGALPRRQTGQDSSPRTREAMLSLSWQSCRRRGSSGCRPWCRG